MSLNNVLIKKKEIKEENSNIQELKSKKMNWIDVAKGICIICIILGHMGNNLAVKIVYAFHIPVFFILSGYTMKREKLDNQYIKKKFSRLMIPYFTTCLFITIMDIIKSICLFQDETIMTGSTVIKNNLIRMFFASGANTQFGAIEIGTRIGAIWFLPAIFFALILSKIMINNSWKFFEKMIVSIVLATISCVLAKFIWLPFSIQSAFLAIPFVLLGYYLKEKDIIKNIRIKETIVFLIIFALGVVFNKSVISVVRCHVDDAIITPIVVVAASLFIIKVSMILEKSKALAYIGRNSLKILCMHLFLMETSYYYIQETLKLLHIKDTSYNNFFVHLIVSMLFVIIVDLIKMIVNKLKSKKKESTKEEKRINNRDVAIDILRAICIIVMIIAHKSIHIELRKIIFSFHMMAFIFLSGYMYKDKKDSLIKILLHEIKRIILPCLLFGTLYIVFKHNGNINEIKTLLYGMSFSKKLFTNIASIGPFYFVLLLFVVKIIYIIISKILEKIKFKSSEKNDLIKTGICVILSLIGITLGQKGYWLPWSIDVALYSILFFNIGYLFRKYDLIKMLMERKYFYFALSPIWVYMIYKGSMEIAIRQYEPYGIVILGSLSGILIMYMLSDYISKHIGKIGKTTLSFAGASTIYVLIVHTLFDNTIIGKLNSMGIYSNNILNLFLSIVIELLIGVLIYLTVELFKRVNQKIYIKLTH